ncbi:MAG: hypothetical protein MUF25_26830 [Pirellulaceae bacterium]|jgi:hypothetical protein|nr:hypothetical protein [Pirellulaceae bacterium]
MYAIRIRKKLESETLSLAELKPLIGKTVEIVVSPEPCQETAPATERWDAAIQAAEELENYDFDAWRNQREYDLSHAHDHLP